MSDDEDGFGTSSDEEEKAKREEKAKKDKERAQQLDVQPKPRRGSFSRRGAVQTCSTSVFQGLKSKYDAMERLEDETARKQAEGVRTSDIDFIRMLQPAQFRTFLMKHGVQVDLFGNSETNAKSVRDLWAEVVFRECDLEQYEDEEVEGGLGLQRRVAVVFIELYFEVEDGTPRYLLLRAETKSALVGRKNLNTRPSRKMYDDEDVESATWRCMFQNLTLPEKICKKHFEIVSSELRTEIKDSSGFPGLRTSYDMHIVKMKIHDPTAPELATLGMPDGVDFQTKVDNVLAGSSVRSWYWATPDEFDAAKAKHAGKASVFHHGGAAHLASLLVGGDDEGAVKPTLSSPRLDGTATRRTSETLAPKMSSDSRKMSLESES